MYNEDLPGPGRNRRTAIEKKEPRLNDVFPRTCTPLFPHTLTLPIHLPWERRLDACVVAGGARRAVAARNDRDRPIGRDRSELYAWPLSAVKVAGRTRPPIPSTEPTGAPIKNSGNHHSGRFIVHVRRCCAPSPAWTADTRAPPASRSGARRLVVPPRRGPDRRRPSRCTRRGDCRAHPPRDRPRCSRDHLGRGRGDSGRRRDRESVRARDGDLARAPCRAPCTSRGA